MSLPIWLYKAIATNFLLSYKDNNHYIDQILNRIIDISINIVQQYIPYTPDMILPKNTTHIILSNNCNRIPDEVIDIIMAPSFNERLHINPLPQYLTKLIFPHNYPLNITPHILPNNIEYLQLSSNFNQDINDEILPKQLKILTLKHPFYEYTNNIPKNVLEVELLHSINNPTYYINGSCCLNINNNKYIIDDLEIDIDINLYVVFRHYMEDYIKDPNNKLIGRIIHDELLLKTQNNI